MIGAGWGRWALVMLAGVGLWLLLAGPGRVLGHDGERVGIGVLMLAVWGLILAVSRLPREALMASASPAEWQARVGLGFMIVAMVYFFARMRVFGEAPLPHNPDATAVARNLVLLLVAWTVISNVLASRWKGVLEADERDREIAANAAGWGRGALIFGIVGIAVMLSFTPPERLTWATPLMIGNLLVFALMWGWLCEYAATLLQYHRDRSQAA